MRVRLSDGLHAQGARSSDVAPALARRRCGSACPARSGTGGRLGEVRIRRRPRGDQPPCSAPTPIVLTANWASTTPSTLTSTWCPAVDEEEPEPEELEWGGSRVVLLSDFSEDGRLPTTSRGPALLATVSSHRHKARYTIFFQFTANGAYVESGHVLLKSTYWPATRIWQGEDAFVNYCIDKHHEITSINHRLGCYEPPLRSVTAKVVWAHPH